MSAASGIGVSTDLSSTFASAVDSNNCRFIKVAIVNESLVPDGTHPISRDLLSDLAQLPRIVEDLIPAFVLVRLDSKESEWMLVSYVPDGAKVRDKMLYASSRSALTRALGDHRFVDTIFATSKTDLTPDGYLAHKRHQAAPHPLSAREIEIANAREAERLAGTAYTGSQTRVNVGGSRAEFAWDNQVVAAIKELAQSPESKLVVLTIDLSTESLVLASATTIGPDRVSSSLPPAAPSYAFFKWHHTIEGEAGVSTIFIYACPALSPVKQRMIYSSGVRAAINAANTLGVQVTRKLETSEPEELTESYLKSEISRDLPGKTSANSEGFARPRGPARKR